MKKLTTVGQAVEQLKDREDQRQAYIHRLEHSQGNHKTFVSQHLKEVEGQIRDLKALRLA